MKCLSPPSTKTNTRGDDRRTLNKTKEHELTELKGRYKVIISHCYQMEICQLLTWFGQNTAHLITEAEGYFKSA